MADIGKLNRLKVLKEVDFGVYLDGGNHGEILLPRRSVPNHCRIDDIIEVFIYLDSEDRIIATTDKPYACVGEFAFLKAVSVTSVGAFLDWGLPKDLLAPFGEQQETMTEGKFYTVFVYLDKTERIVASSKLEKFLDDHPGDLSKGEEVDLLVCRRTDLGFNAIINNSCWGVLYKNEIFQKLEEGQKVRGYIDKIRKDQKIDLSLNKIGQENIDALSQKIIELLKKQGGFLKITDKSSPKIISEMFGASKKSYKKAIGSLYKKRIINLEEDGIRQII